MRSHLALLVVLLSLIVTGTATTASGVSTHPASTDFVAGDRAAVNETATNGTTIRIQPRPNGDARWNISMQFALDDENETAAFKSLGRDFEDQNADGEEIGFSADTFRNIAEREQAATGREMQIRNVERNYSVHNQTGTLTLRFIWTNFTRVDGDEVFLGDVFLYNDGESTWFRSLSENQDLIIETPDGYQIQDSNSGHNNGTITMNGPTTIRSQTGGEGYIDVTYQEESNPTPPPSTPWWMYLAGLLVLVGIVGVGVYAFLQRDDSDSSTDAEIVDQQSASAAGPEPAEEDEPDVELLSDEERVEHLLEKNGGRMKQASIVKQTNWSNAKVSQLLSSMNENDRINKLRIGRENLITLPGEDITDFDTE